MAKPNVSVLAVDIGGSHVKILVSGSDEEPRRAPSGPDLTPTKMVETVKGLAVGWSFDAVSIGFPGPVVHDSPMAEPKNLGEGWVGFDFEAAFGRPVRVLNDAAMQALGSYEGGRMLFLGLGTGLGSAMIFDGVIVPMELAHLPYKKGRTYEDYVGRRGMERRGKQKWRASVLDVVERLRAALGAEYVVLGGGNAKKMDELAPDTHLGANTNAFKGGFAVWAREPAEPTASVGSIGRAVASR